MQDDIDTMNKFLVASNGHGLVIMMPPRGPMTEADALLLAAYLVAMSAGGKDAFEKVLAEVEST